MKSLRTPVQATPQPHRPQDNTPTLADDYFSKLILGHERRFERVVRVAKSITEFRHQEFAGPNRVYNGESPLKTPIALAQAILETMLLKQDTKSYRYDLLYFSNAVDQYNSRQLEVSQGRRNKSVAFDEISRGDKKKRETARRMYSDACRYLEILETGGPGSLLSIDAASKSE
jgi:hypothetical protein